LMATAGLPNLGGAKIELDLVDHQGSPSVGQNQTTRLITQDNVAAIIGSYHSSVSMTATAAAARYGVPFVVGDSVALNITQRGFKNVFRVTPIATDFAKDYTMFLGDLKKAGHDVKSIGVVYENTDYGSSVSEVVKKAAKEQGFKIAADISYNANTTDVSAQVLQLKQADPDAVIFISYTSDAILYIKTLKNLDYRPKMLIGDDAGFSDPSFVKTVGNDAQGAVNRSVWQLGKKGSPTYELNELYKKKTGRDLDDPSARSLQAMIVLADAINRAGSTDHDAIIAALAKTDMPQKDMFVGYRGVRFDETGQNELAATFLIQLDGKEYKTIWPESAAVTKIQWPYKGWK
ncbi:MAG TPA: ABC transporter substrate-binding protein, partial [Alphaproteobacteria bacterium]|nr:ABC transporter substrate-binding protein [Alphaproteobacteria bacterium]